MPKDSIILLSSVSKHQTACLIHGRWFEKNILKINNKRYFKLYAIADCKTDRVLESPVGTELELSDWIVGIVTILTTGLRSPNLNIYELIEIQE